MDNRRSKRSKWSK